MSNDYPFFEYDGKIDIFYSNGVLHHTPKIAEILQRVSEILKSDGDIRLMLYSEKSYLLYADSILPPIEEVLDKVNILINLLKLG